MSKSKDQKLSSKDLYISLDKDEDYNNLLTRLEKYCQDNDLDGFTEQIYRIYMMKFKVKALTLKDDRDRLKVYREVASISTKDFPDGSPSVHNAIGEIYHKLKDLPRAFSYFSLAAAGNNPSGLHSVGICYRRGEGVIQDNKQAFFYINESTKIYGMQLSDHHSLTTNIDNPTMANNYFTLGFFYQYGIGTDINMQKAKSLFLISSKFGSQEAEQRLIKFFPS